MRLLIVLLITLISPFFNTAFSEERKDEKKWYIPDHYLTQFAGNIGYISQGAGYSLWGDKYHAELIYGFIHEWHAGINIHHITQKNIYRPWKRDISKKYSFIPLTVGLHVSYKVGNNNYETWLKLPDRYPDKYYLPTSVHLLPTLGSSLCINKTPWQFMKKTEVYYEIGSVDTYILHLSHEKSHLTLADIINLAFGVKINF